MGAAVTIVVVTYNSAHVIDALLDSVPAALGDVSADVVVVDNDSADDTAEAVARRPDVRLVQSANAGFAAGINRGVHEGERTAYVLALNPDVVLGPGSVAEMIRAAEAHGAGIVAPQVRQQEGALYHSLRREPSLARTLGLNATGLPLFAEYILRDEEYLEGHVVDWALGAVLLFRREVFDVLGGWEEAFFLYSEETDFCLRARDHGYTTRYEPLAVAMHIGGQSGQTPATHAMRTVNRVRSYARRHGPVQSWLFFGLTLLRELSWVPRAGERSRVAVRALLRPSTRPPEIGCSDRLLPL